MKKIIQFSLTLVFLSLLLMGCRKDKHNFCITEKYSEVKLQKEVFYGFKNLMVSIDFDDQFRVRIYDFTNIENPIVHFFRDIKNVFAGQIKNDRMFLLVDPTSTTVDGHLEIYDVSNLSAPILLGELDLGDRSFEHVEYHEGNLYFVGSTGVFYYPLDESQLEAGQVLTVEPQLLMSYELTFSPDVQQMFFSENKFVVVRRAGVWIADVSDAIAPDSLGMIPIREHFTTLSAALTDNKLCVMEDRDIFVYEFPSLDLKGEIEMNKSNTMVALDKNTIMLNGPAKFKFLDISNSSKPKYLNDISIDGEGVADYIQFIDESSFITRELNHVKTYLMD